MNDRSLGLQALAYYANAVGEDLNSFVAYYDKQSPKLIVNFGGAVRLSNLSQSRIKDAMTSIARFAKKGDRPFYGSFFDALAGERQTFRFDDLKDVAAKTAQDVKRVATLGISLWLVPTALVAAFFIFKALSKKGSR